MMQVLNDASGDEMTQQVKIQRVWAPRRRVSAKASSGERRQPLDIVLQHYEAQDPAAAARTGLTSAGMRAGAIVRGMRRSVGLPQAELAKRLGVSQERVSEIERGAGPQGPTFELLERIASACGMVLMPMEREQAEALQESAAAATSMPSTF